MYGSWTSAAAVSSSTPHVAPPEPKQDGWETIDHAFEKSREPFWLYWCIVEKGQEATEPMHATALGRATQSVVNTVRTLHRGAEQK